MITIPNSVHAILSASKAHMWLACSGALAAGKGIPPSPPSKYAAEGTVYHDVARRALIENKDCNRYVGDKYEVDGFKFTIDADNAEFAQVYVDAIRALPGKRCIEVDLEYSALLGVPKYPGKDGVADTSWQLVAAGTGDSVTLDFEAKVIYVTDLKFGRGDIVYAKDNPQLRLYGVAAVDRYELLGVEDDWRAVLAINQPRVSHFDSETITVGELRAWTAAQKQRANRAYTLWAHPELATIDDLTPGDKQCRWCPLSGNCVAQKEAMLRQFPVQAAPDAKAYLLTLDDMELAAERDLCDWRDDYTKAVRAEALTRALRGAVLPNWKLVTGRRGARKLDEAATITLDLEAAGELGMDDLDEETVQLTVPVALDLALGKAMYAPAEILTAAKLEKALTKKAPKLWAALQPYISQSDGAPGLERMEDPRPAMVNMGAEFPIVENGKESLI